MIPFVPRPSRRRALALLGGGLLAAILAAAPLWGVPAPSAASRANTAPAVNAPKRLLVVTVTKGFRHDSIPVAEETLALMGVRSRMFTVDYARTDADIAQKMSRDGLKRYDAVFFANTTGDLPLPDREAFLQWVRDGHGFIGAHAATDTFPGFPGYISLIGGQFAGHGPQVEVNCRVEDKSHPATRHLGNGFKVFDEIYLFKNFSRDRVHGLLTLDAHPNQGTPGDYPVAWTRTEGKGRVFYTSLGHRQEIWRSPWYQQHLLGGIRWAMRDAQ